MIYVEERMVYVVKGKSTLDKNRFKWKMEMEKIRKPF